MTSGVIAFKEGIESFPDEQRQALSITDFDVDAEPTFDWSAGDSNKIKFPNRVYAIGARSGPSTMFFLCLILYFFIPTSTKKSYSPCYNYSSYVQIGV